MNFFQKLFQNNLPGMEAVRFSHLEWPEVDRQKHRIIWQSEEFPAQLSMNYFPTAPDLPRPLSNLEKLRKFYRKKLFKVDGGVILAEPFDIQTYRAIETIFKIPMKENGYIYIGSITIPFADCSYVIKIQAQEYTHIGERERLVKERLEKDGKETEPWHRDPYAPDITDQNAMNKAEAIQFDLFFPDHPLSRVRSWMYQVRNSIEMDPALAELEKLTD